MKITQFIMSRIEQAGLKPELIAKECNIGQATIYRYIRGERTIPPAIEKKLVKILKMSETEKQEFHAIIEQSVPHKPYKKAFQILDAMVFDGTLAQNDIVIGDEVIFLEKDRYLISTSELYERMLRHADSPSFQCSIRIIDGIGDSYFNQIASLVDDIFKCTSNVIVEHLVPFSTKDDSSYLQILMAVLPFLKHNKYKLYYIESEGQETASRIFGKSFYFSTSYDEYGERKNEYFMVSIREFGKTECYCFSDPFLHEFFTNEFFDIRRRYKKSFIDSRTTNNRIDFFIKKMETFPSICIMPGLSYAHVPETALCSYFARLTDHEKQMMADGYSDRSIPSEMIDEAIGQIAQEAKMHTETFRNQLVTDICSKAGLLELAQTGRNHGFFKWIPSLNKNEIRRTLEYIRDRNIDDNDSYTLYITEKPIFIENYIYGYRGTGIIFELNKEYDRVNFSNSFYIENKSIADLFFRYVEDYFPSNYAVSKEDATAYINSLIEKYLQ